MGRVVADEGGGLVSKWNGILVAVVRAGSVRLNVRESASRETERVIGLWSCSPLWEACLHRQLVGQGPFWTPGQIGSGGLLCGLKQLVDVPRQSLTTPPTDGLKLL